MKKELDTKSELKRIRAEILKQSIAEDKDIYSGGVCDRLENLMRFPEAVEPALDLMGEAMDKLGVYIKYTVPPITRALQQAAKTRPDLSEKIFARFDDLKEMLGNEDSRLYGSRFEPYEHAYHALEHISVFRSELAEPALEKFKEFVNSPGNNADTLEIAAEAICGYFFECPEKLQGKIDEIYKEILKSDKLRPSIRKSVNDYYEIFKDGCRATSDTNSSGRSGGGKAPVTRE